MHTEYNPAVPSEQNVGHERNEVNCVYIVYIYNAVYACSFVNKSYGTHRPPTPNIHTFDEHSLMKQIVVYNFYISILCLRNVFLTLILPYRFRLKIDNNGGAWCPKHMVSRGLTEYLQVDLLGVHLVSAIRTQGRFGKGQGQEYTEAYVIEYWRPGLKKWIRWRSLQGKEVS